MSDLVTAEIEGFLEPVQVPLDRALDMLWTTMQALPLGNLQLKAYGHFFGVGVEGRVQEAIEQDGRLQLTFAMEDRLHSLTVTPAVSPQRAR
jgi:hypothetical protein